MDFYTTIVSRFLIILSLWAILFPVILVSQSADSLLRLIHPTQPDTVRVQALREIGYGLLYDDPDSARQYFDRALGLSEGLKDTAGQAAFTNLIGATYYLTGRLETAMEYYLRALTWSEYTGNQRYLGIIHNNIGAVYYELDEYDKAKDYYEKAMGLFEVVRDTFWLSNALNNLSNSYLKGNMPKQALDTYKKSLELARISNNLEAIGSALSNMGNILMEMGKNDSAFLLYQQGVGYHRQAGDHIGEAINYNNMGMLLQTKGDLKEAIRYHHSALRIAEKYQHLETMANTKRWLSEAYYRKGAYRRAYDLHNEYIALKDSLQGLAKANAIHEMEQKYQSAKKEQAITRLELEKKNAALALSQSENQRNLLVLGTVVLFLLAIFLQSRYRNKKKNSELLARKNEQISAALEERELLLREIHHRVKNNLQIISSLLKLQAESLSDAAAVDAVREGENRVKSMSLIHQRLYSTEDVRGVALQDYFERLFEELFAAFGVDREHVQFHVDTNTIKLDIDTVIPLGLIVNELITNALKYAFTGSEQGVISLRIRESEDRLRVTLSDNGHGMSEEQIASRNSFGWKMVRSLSRKLKAEIHIDGTQGTRIELILARYKLVS